MSFDAREYLGSDELRSMVIRFVRRRVPEAEVDDLVQTILVAALEAAELPDEREDVRRWVAGVARHKVADLHRKGKRVQQVDLPEDLSTDEAPISARDLARWAAEQAAGSDEAGRTLGWMAREGGGEKLAHIAEDEDLPAPQVRQRVSRLRRFLREQWKAELAAVAAVVIAVLLAWTWLRDPAPQPVAPSPDVTPRPDPGPPVAPSAPPDVPSPVDRARDVRRLAFEDCAASRWRRCLDGLDEAAELDPEGDRAPAVGVAREEAKRGLAVEDEVAPPDAKPQTTSAPKPTAAPPVTKEEPPAKAPPTKAPPTKTSSPTKQLPSKPSGLSSDWFPDKGK